MAAWTAVTFEGDSTTAGGDQVRHTHTTMPSCVLNRISLHIYNRNFSPYVGDESRATKEELHSVSVSTRWLLRHSFRGVVLDNIGHSP